MKNNQVMDSPHIIGRQAGSEPGPLLICIAGMHGNEPAGVLALQTVMHLLDREPLVNHDFKFKGHLLALLGNTRAYQEKKRFIEKDINRQWTRENIAHIRQTPADKLKAEDLEIKELLEIIEAEIETCRPERIVMLDLHTTSASGGIFAIATDHPESVRIAVELHAPVITGMLRGLRGTTLHYFTGENFKYPVVGAAFEAGQHDDPLSVQRSIAAIINCLRSVGCVRPEDVENKHDDLLKEYSRDLPKIADLIKVHSITAADQFEMQPGYQNFQPVTRDEVLARDRKGIIRSPDDGLILMPLYQPQGSDGFFLVKKIA
ncbi:MAG: succinylglutamate desuccinylase/aspartoacylase family protein [Lewinellaceae bacterium]|nr:succinylglutamate desuccinylase/aspartoacylase family protein [Saprospiraceae bacterium]MCB9337264.1 succinylglutamate desuccinylase/aspartoacylase family protein [Lewinellaceae bacterium]